MFLARLKHRDPRQGYVLGRFGMKKLLFEAGAPAIEVSAEDAAILREVREIDGNTMSPLAFDVWNPDKEPAPPEMVIAKMNRNGITSADLHGAFVPRSEIDAIVAREVAKALAAVAKAQAKAVAPAVASAEAETPSEAQPEKSPAEQQAERVSRYFPVKDKKK